MCKQSSGCLAQQGGPQHAEACLPRPTAAHSSAASSEQQAVRSVRHPYELSRAFKWWEGSQRGRGCQPQGDSQWGELRTRRLGPRKHRVRPHRCPGAGRQRSKEPAGWVRWWGGMQTLERQRQVRRCVGCRRWSCYTAGQHYLPAAVAHLVGWLVGRRLAAHIRACSMTRTGRSSQAAGGGRGYLGTDQLPGARAAAHV